MKSSEDKRWEELLEAARAVKLDHIPREQIEQLFVNFINQAKRELPTTPDPRDQKSALAGLGWLLAGAVYLLLLVPLKNGL